MNWVSTTRQVRHWEAKGFPDGVLSDDRGGVLTVCGFQDCGGMGVAGGRQPLSVPGTVLGHRGSAMLCWSPCCHQGKQQLGKLGPWWAEHTGWGEKES